MAFDAEKALRQVLWEEHGFRFHHGDGGEMQCSVCVADFEQDPLEKLWQLRSDCMMDLVRKDAVKVALSQDPILSAMAKAAGMTPEEMAEGVQSLLDNAATKPKGR